jgi:predicted GNAT superfamily acetyltransferase
MGHIAVRAARPGDEASLRAINAAGQPGVSPLTPEEVAAIAAGAIRCWIAEVAGAVGGYLVAYASGDAYDGEEFGWFRGRYPAFLYVDQVAVAAGGRRTGVGSALYRVAMEHARAGGLTALTCEVNLEPPNPVSLGFHRALGFREVGVLRTADGRTVALLHLDLPATGGALVP